MDTVADALIRIKNGYKSLKADVTLPYSKLILAICEVLKKQEFIEKFESVKSAKNSQFLQITVTLKYDSKKPVLTQVKRISKPGLRIYKGNKALPRVLNGLGIAIISTPKGVMSDSDARKEGVGGEVLAYIW